MDLLWKSLKLFIFLMLLTGFVYPLLITIISQLTMHDKANGSFITVNGKIVGSRFIGQTFESDKYFWSRPSAVNYNPLPSGGSNLGPISVELKKLVEERKAKLKKSHLSESRDIPTDLLYASGSGLDPHISIEAAYYQFDRVSKARNLNTPKREALNDIIVKHAQHRDLRFLESSYINVLELNKALDELNH